jgi:hypothetical protein
MVTFRLCCFRSHFPLLSIDAPTFSQIGTTRVQDEDEDEGEGGKGK